MQGDSWEPIPEGIEVKADMPRPKRHVDARIKNRLQIRKEVVLKRDPAPGCDACREAVAGQAPKNHDEFLRDRFEQIFLDAEVERIAGQVERMAPNDEQAAGSSEDAGTTPEKGDVNEEDAMGDDKEHEPMGAANMELSLSRSIMSSLPDGEVQKGRARIYQDVDAKKKDRKSSDDVERTSEAL